MGQKTLKECEEHLSDIKARLKDILQEQEQAVKDWNTAFMAESPEKVECICECSSARYRFLLVKGETRIEVASVWADDFEKDLEEFHKALMTAIGIQKIVNKSWNSFPEHYENLVIAKAMEVREKMNRR